MAKSWKRRTMLGTLVLTAILVSGCPVPGSGGYLVYPLSLDFSGYKDELVVNVNNYCAADGPWTASVDVPWLTVTPDTGAGEATQVTVTVTRPELKAMDIGKNDATIRFTFSGGVQNVPVTAWLWPDLTFEEWIDEGSDLFPPPKQPGGLISTEYLNDVEVSPDGGYVGVGFIWQEASDADFGADSAAKNVVVGDAYVVKTDIDGEKIWSINWGTSGWSEANAVVVADDGNYVVAGWQTAGDDFFAKGFDPRFYAQLTKVSQDGVIMWQKLFGDGTWWAKDIQKTADGGFIIAGDNFSDGWSDADVYVPLLIKTDADGNEEWSKLYDTLTYDHYVYGVDVADDGTIVVAGQSFPLPLKEDAKPTKRGGDEAKQLPEMLRLFLMRTEPNGNVQWRREFTGEGGAYGRDVTALPGQGGYVACGGIQIGPREAGYALKVDITGEEVWGDFFEVGDLTEFHAVVRDDDGNFMLAGRAVMEGSPKQPSSFDALLLKIDGDGVPQSPPILYGNDGPCWFNGLRMTPDAGYIAVGSSVFDFLGPWVSDAYLVKTDPSGELEH
ncbi:MAG: BACON domain-containing protein [bacterium]|nr:BACON domain-containing protein [bacterium]